MDSSPARLTPAIVVAMQCDVEFVTVLNKKIVLGSNKCLHKTAASKDKDFSKSDLQHFLTCCPGLNVVYIDHQHQLLPAGSEINAHIIKGCQIVAFVG